MQVFKRIDDIRVHLTKASSNGQSIGFVPTMGALHEGHASLIRAAARENDVVVVSVFVNPTQFGLNEDLDQYPRTLQADIDLSEQNGATVIFAPDESVIYPEGKEQYQIQFSLRSLDQILCGAKRPGHFDGVLQVVSKLFNIVRPDRAYFGEKDFQQLTILRTLVRELFFPLEIVGCPIIREEDGLALSSRNRYLSETEREQALFLSKTLQKIQDHTRPGLSLKEATEIVAAELPKYPLIRLDYFDIRSGHDLSPVAVLDPKDKPRAFLAAFCGTTRLIDNLDLFPETE